MVEINNDPIMILILSFIFMTCVQLGLAIYMASKLRLMQKENSLLNKEMFGALKKLEGLTSNKREQILRHYDKMLENLSSRLPPTVAAQTSQAIFETESKILARLAEIDQSLGKDERSKRKMDELIKSMENLEQTIVVLTADTVRKVMIDSRRNLLEEELDTSLAA